MLDAIEHRWQQLARHPYSGFSREDIAPDLRHLVIRQYLILYRVGAETIEIVRVLHGRRKLDRWMIEISRPPALGRICHGGWSGLMSTRLAP